MKMMWSPRSMEQIREIVDYIKKDKREAATQWANLVFSLAEGLAATPWKGRIVPEVQRKNVREVFHGKYRIIYRVDEDAIVVLAVRHGYRVLRLKDLSV